ncbi:MAG: hypothetical protein U0Q12_26585 [Vicinamibacterales bacterium]
MGFSSILSMFALLTVAPPPSVLAALPGADARELVAQASVDDPTQLAPGDVVWVTMNDGRQLQGRIVSVGGRSLTIDLPTGPTSLSLADVRRIEAPDARADGVRRGALAGGVAAGAYFGMIAYGLRCERQCGQGYSAARDVAGAAVLFGALGAGTGALIGLAIDAMVHGRRTVYEASAGASTSWEVVPVHAARGVGVRMVVVW